MTVLLNRAYQGYLAGATATFPASTEASLIAQGLASAATTITTTTGAATTTAMRGTASIAIGASSVVITNANVTADSCVFAVINQAAADATLLRVERVAVSNGSFTIFGTANATAAVIVNWSVVNSYLVPLD